MSGSILPGLQDDMLKVISLCNAVIMAAGHVIADCAGGDCSNVHARLTTMADEADELDGLVAICRDTTDHLGDGA